MLIALCGLAHAVDVKLDYELNTDLADELGIDVPEIEIDLDDAISEELHLDDIEVFLASMANAAAISSKGLGVDYAMDDDAYVFGAGIGTAIHSSGLSFSKEVRDEGLPENGFAFQVTMMGGVNLGAAFKARDKAFSRRVRLFVNGLYFPVPASAKFSGVMYNLGAHGQIQLATPVDFANPKVGAWTGVQLTAGIERAWYRLELDRDLKIREKPVTWKAAGDFEVVAFGDVMPVELSTGLRLWWLTGWFGAAIDTNLGFANGFANLDGPVNAWVDKQRYKLGRVELDMEGAGFADRFVPRGFAGGELKIWKVKLYGHVNVANNGSWGSHTGLRGAF